MLHTKAVPATHQEREPFTTPHSNLDRFAHPSRDSRSEPGGLSCAPESVLSAPWASAESTVGRAAQGQPLRPSIHRCITAAAAASGSFVPTSGIASGTPRSTQPEDAAHGGPRPERRRIRHSHVVEVGRLVAEMLAAVGRREAQDPSAPGYHRRVGDTRRRSRAGRPVSDPGAKPSNRRSLGNGGIDAVLPPQHVDRGERQELVRRSVRSRDRRRWCSAAWSRDPD